MKESKSKRNDQSPKKRKMSSTKRLCSAMTTTGSPCARPAMAGLTVCSLHGGGTTASSRKSTRASFIQHAVLWGISTGAGSLSVETELRKLIKQKLADIQAIRIELSKNPEQYYGMMLDSKEESISSSEHFGSEDKIVTTHRNSVHPLVTELHKAENEVLAMLKTLQGITGSTDEIDTQRLKQQTARQVARLMRAYPGLSIDEISKEVSRHG